ncbi:MAG: DUF485 domain-containing protein [Hydrogenibacillus sp.]|nr:DUF485 domain-containing protein [Hydrogenibacillus sp.]
MSELITETAEGGGVVERGSGLADRRLAEIARSDAFRALTRRKMAFVWPVTVGFVAFYLILPLLAGYARPLMGTFVVGHVTFGYAYGLIYYGVAWALAYVYVRTARTFDRRAREIAEHSERLERRR